MWVVVELKQMQESKKVVKTIFDKIIWDIMYYDKSGWAGLTIMVNIDIDVVWFDPLGQYWHYILADIDIITSYDKEENRRISMFTGPSRSKQNWTAATYLSNDKEY